MTCSREGKSSAARDILLTTLVNERFNCKKYLMEVIKIKALITIHSAPLIPLPRSINSSRVCKQRSICRK